MTMKKALFIALFALILAGCGQTGTDTQNTPATPQVMNPNAPVLVEEFSDLQCPACGQVSPQATELARKIPDKMKLAFYHFPLSYHEFAFIAAQAAECAGDQGKFWEFTDTVYKTQNSLSEDHLYNVAKQLGLDETAFKTCVDSGSKKAIVQADQLEGQKRQIPGTPTFFVNGQMVQWSGADTFEKYVTSLAK